MNVLDDLIRRSQSKFERKPHAQATFCNFSKKSSIRRIASVQWYPLIVASQACSGVP